jgi:trimeric autotransporter adhesin
MFSFFSKRTRANGTSANIGQTKKSNAKRRKRPYSLEPLEDRSLMTTFTVANLNDSGAGSFRQAITDANNAVGADTIEFDVAGTIALKKALPTIIDTVNIDGSTAPGYVTAPVVAVDFSLQAGLKFQAGADQSEVRNLSLINASDSGVKVSNAGGMLFTGNYVGLNLDGTTIVANRKHGLEFVNSNENVIGGFTQAGRNVISGNRNEGIHFSNSSNNFVYGTYIGTDSTGTLDRGNQHSGIIITDGSANNVIGGSTMNVVSGNDAEGIKIKGKATGNKIDGNIIGLTVTGDTALGNKLDGIKIDDAANNIIGNIDAIRNIDYYGTDAVGADVTGWAGIRGGDVDGEYLISGSADVSGVLNGLLYVGNIEGTSGTAYPFVVPGSINTNAYGPNNLGSGNLQIVGTYGSSNPSDPAVNGFLFEGTVSDLQTPSAFRTVNYPGAEYTYLHSTAGGLVVGNYDSPTDHGAYSLPFGPGHALIYDIDSDTFLEDIHFPGSISNSAYGIWHNGGTSYTIVGGYSTAPVDNFADQEQPLDKGYIVDYDSSTGEFTHWMSLEYPYYGPEFLTHIQGISSVEKGVYTLSADSIEVGSGNPAQGAWVSVRRNTDGSFALQDWVNLEMTVDPNTGDPVEGLASANSVYGNQVVGIFIGDTVFNYQASINTGFQLSNIISGNGSDGIDLYKANNNTVAMNYIGTDITGTIDLGNAKNGILIGTSSENNMIGGEATGGNSPTNGVFAVPPQGNLISGNNNNGVLINGKATNNQLSGNFIGTNNTGNVALGNTQDGVLIDGANGNSLIGCTFQQDPFVFYNVLSGNGGNGLRVKNSNDTVIQANFFGLGANNDAPVGNALNGVIVEGSSKNTVMGGVIPLGNVSAANGLNGVVVQDKASDFISFNTFSGVSAFGAQADLGNGQDGVLITSTGANILVRTCILSSNGDDGIEISGKAKGVQVFDVIIGLNWDGTSIMSNGNNGVEIGGNASNILIGGTVPDEFSVSPRNAIGGNLANGIAIIGKAKNNTINHSYIGTDIFGQVDLGNLQAGVYLGSGTSGNTIGSTEFALQTLISGNDGDGIEMNGSSGNTVIGTIIGTDPTSALNLGNGANGIYLTNSSKNTIGGAATGEGNIITHNQNDGVYVQSGTKNGIIQNSIYDNGPFGIELAAGANNNQPAPVLTSVDGVSGGTEITGTLTAKKKTTYTIEFFASNLDNASGRYFLGSITVTTNSSGVATFTASVLTPPIGSDFITATATDPDNNTSMFSAAIQA